MSGAKRLNGDSKQPKQRQNGDTKRKNKKMQNIYTPRPGGAEDDDDDHTCEIQNEPDAPTWHRHFEADELLGRYEPIRELGTFQIDILYRYIYMNISIYI